MREITPTHVKTYLLGFLETAEILNPGIKEYIDWFEITRIHPRNVYPYADIVDHRLISYFNWLRTYQWIMDNDEINT